MTDKGNRVVIRINYDNDRKRKELIDPKMVTVWHKGRIFGVFAISVLLIGLIIFLSSGTETQENKAPVVESIEETKSIEPVQQPVEPAKKPEIITQKPAGDNLPPEPVKSSPKVISSNRPSAIIFDKRVIRASLTTAPQYGEPGDPLTPLVIIKPEQTLDAFYFSEIKGMKNRVLFHHWFKNGRLVYEKQFDVETDKFKLISSKKLSSKDVGEWRVTLIDKKGKDYSEVNFSVNP
ncbi:DUF2914 domain-containing protein [Methylomonas sp. MgM2]